MVECQEAKRLIPVGSSRAGSRARRRKRVTKTDPSDAYFAERSPDQRALLEKLRALVRKALPDAAVVIKWGVPCYAVNGNSICALASFKDHVGLNIFASPAILADPGKKLEGAGKTSRMLKVRTAADIDAAAITRWLNAAAKPARA